MKHAAILLLFLCGFAFLTWNSISHEPYFYDEADYLYAVSRGPLPNAVDSPTMPLVRFLQLGLQRGKRADQRVSLSEAVRNNNDIVFYRHWHGPLLFYYLMLVHGIDASESASRAAMLLFPVFALFITYCGCLWVLPEPMRMGGAILCSALVFWNYVPARSSEVAPHQLFALTFLAALLLLAKAIASGDRRYWYLAVAASALAFDTLEVAFVLVLTLAIFAWIERRQLRADLRLWIRSVGLFSGVVFVVWPGALIKLSFLKAYFFLVYLAIARKAPWGEVTLLDTWRMRLMNNAVDWIALALAVILFVVRKDLATRRIAAPFLLFGVLMLGVVFRVATVSARYDLPFLQAFDIFSGLILTAGLYELRPVARRAAITAVACACLLVAAVAMGRSGPPNRRLALMLESIREQRLSHSRLLVPQEELPVIHYYYPQTQLRAYTGPQPDAADLHGAPFDAVLLPGVPVTIERP